MFRRLRGSKPTGGKPAVGSVFVIENPAIDSVERKAVDHAGVAVGDKDLTRCSIKRQRAKRGP